MPDISRVRRSKDGIAAPVQQDRRSAESVVIQPPGNIRSGQFLRSAIAAAYAANNLPLEVATGGDNFRVVQQTVQCSSRGGSELSACIVQSKENPALFPAGERKAAKSQPHFASLRRRVHRYDLRSQGDYGFQFGPRDAAQPPIRGAERASYPGWPPGGNRSFPACSATDLARKVPQGS